MRPVDADELYKSFLELQSRDIDIETIRIVIENSPTVTPEGDSEE